jgi:hypothetical protein
VFSWLIFTSPLVYHNSFCQLRSSISLPWVIYFEAFYLHVVSSFYCIPVICPKLELFLTLLQFVHLFCYLSQVYPAVLLMHFISAAVILLASLPFIVSLLKVAILPLDLTCPGPENPFRGNFNHWQVWRKEAGQILVQIGQKWRVLCVSVYVHFRGHLHYNSVNNLLL